jgi:hypothetical protein
VSKTRIKEFGTNFVPNSFFVSLLFLEDKLKRTLLAPFTVQSDENSCFEVIIFLKSKALRLMILVRFVHRFQFGVRIG